MTQEQKINMVWKNVSYDEIYDTFKITCCKELVVVEKEKQSKLLNNINQLPDDVINIILDYMPSYKKDIVAIGKIYQEYDDEIDEIIETIKITGFKRRHFADVNNNYSHKLKKYLKCSDYRRNYWNITQLTQIDYHNRLDRFYGFDKNFYRLFHTIDDWAVIRLGTSIVKQFSKQLLIGIANIENIPIKKSWNRSKIIGVMIKHL